LVAPAANLHFSFNAGYTTLGSSAPFTLVPAVQVTVPTANFNRSIPLDLGDQARSLGIQLDSDPNTPGVQPVQIGVEAHLNITGLTVGIPLTSPSPYLVPGLSLAANFKLTIPAITMTVNLSLLQASITLATAKEITGSITLTPHDLDSNSKLDRSELVPPNVGVTTSFLPNPLIITMNADIAEGVKIGGTKLLSATLNITIPTPFGTSAGPAVPQVTFNTSLGGGADLLQSFSNAGPNEI